MWDKKREITIKTLHGKVKYIRPFWYCKDCGYGEYPSDASYGIDQLSHKLTSAVKEELVFFAQNQMSFADAEKIVKRVFPFEVNRETIREIAEEVGARVFEQDTLKAEQLLLKIQSVGTEEKIPGTVYIMMDGATVNTRIKDEAGSTWRENKTVIAFSSKDLIKRKNGDNIITQKEIAPFIGTSHEFRKYVLSVAVAAGYGKYEKTVIIADGAAWIRNICDELFPDAMQILDLFHLKENIYSFAKYVEADTAKMVAFAETVIDKIENHYDIDGAINSIPVFENHPQNVPNLRTYFENNRNRMDYPLFKALGFFVGSGAMESTHKTIVQQRLKRAGMRWDSWNAQALLILRAKDESNHWEEVENVCAYKCAV
jgi:hypothetical protein